MNLYGVRVILAYIWKKFNKPCVIFGAFGRKTKIAQHFWENLRKFSKDFFRNLRKCIILDYFSKSLTNTCVHFSPFGQKRHCWEILNILDENSIDKLNFIIIFRKIVTKNRAFGNNTIFLQQFFRLGGGFPSPSP